MNSFRSTIAHSMSHRTAQECQKYFYTQANPPDVMQQEPSGFKHIVLKQIFESTISKE